MVKREWRLPGGVTALECRPRTLHWPRFCGEIAIRLGLTAWCRDISVAAGQEAGVLGGEKMSATNSAGTDEPHPIGNTRPQPDHCETGVQPLAGAAIGARDPSLHRHGLWLFGVLAAPNTRGRRRWRDGMPPDGPRRSALHNHLRLADQ